MSPIILAILILISSSTIGLFMLYVINQDGGGIVVSHDANHGWINGTRIVKKRIGFRYTLMGYFARFRYAYIQQQSIGRIHRRRGDR